MRLRDLAGRRVCLLGFGREGSATLEVLQRAAVLQGEAAPRVSIADRQPIADVPCPVLSGPDYLRAIEDHDVVIRSPGVWDPRLELVAHKVTTPTNLLLAEAAQRGTTVVGVTGTKGKSTTSSLIHHLLVAAGRPARLLGNIGVPAITALLDPEALSEVLVLELSSFQLHDLERGPTVGVITSFFDEHLDYHGTAARYEAAKARLFARQRAGDYALFDAESAACRRIAAHSPGVQVEYRAADVPDGATRLRGQHNRGNAAAACAAVAVLGVPPAATRAALSGFAPLQHRLATVGGQRGVTWIDDSLATIPEAVIAALDSLAPDVGTLIVGGHDRGFYRFDALAEAIVGHRVGVVVTLPTTGTQVSAALERCPRPHATRAFPAGSMEEAVRIAAAHTQPGRIALLSPGAPSHNMFRDYRDRSAAFRRCIEQLDESGADAVATQS